MSLRPHDPEQSALSLRGPDPIPATQLLDTWQEAAGQHPLHRALTLLRLGEPDLPLDAAATLPLGERDRRLFTLRERLSGGVFDAVAGCVACGESMELGFTAADLLSSIPKVTPDALIEHGDLELRLRPPSTMDAMRAAAMPSRAAARALLLECCVSGTGEPLPDGLIARVEARLEEIDPLADIRLDVQCPACGHRDDAPFDVGAYLWAEIDARARMLLRDVDTLARTYGWAEADILAMDPRRRQAYLAFQDAP